MSLYFNAGQELLEKAQEERDAAIEALRIAEVVRDDARAHSQRLLDEKRALKAELAEVTLQRGQALDRESKLLQHAFDEIDHAVRLAGCYLTGGDSPPLRADTTPTLARAVIALHAQGAKLREAGLALRDTAIDIENQRYKAEGEAINAELERDIKIVQLKAERDVLRVQLEAERDTIFEVAKNDIGRVEWLEADVSRLEDVRGHINNEGGTVREAIDFFRSV